MAGILPLPLKASDGVYTAENYDQLADSPFEVGTFQETDFDESGAHFLIVIDAEPADTRPIRSKIPSAKSWLPPSAG